MKENGNFVLFFLFVYLFLLYLRKEKFIMVKKIIGCADIHIKNLKGLDELKESLGVFLSDCEKIVKSCGGAENARIVVAGDIFNMKIDVTNESMLVADWFMKGLNDICPTYVIAGNHDYLVNNAERVDSLTPIFRMNEFQNVHFLDMDLGYQSGYVIDDNIVWCLYSSFEDFASPDITLVKAENPDKTFVGLIHADIAGAVLPTGQETGRGLDASMFKDMDFVIAGHIHKYQTIKKNGVPITYCSSLVQKDFGETVTHHGFVTWDLENGNKPKFQEVDKLGRGFYKFSLNSIDDIDEDKEELINY